VCSLSVASGLLHHAVTTIKEILSELPGSPRTQVGFITYDNTVQFYNLKHTMSQPQMMVCPDPDDR
jgi:protein transport protein SEC24